MATIQSTFSLSATEKSTPSQVSIQLLSQCGVDQTYAASTQQTEKKYGKYMGFGANGGAHLTGMYMQMADGKVLGLNYFDNKIYCFGRGPSATTVTASPKVRNMATAY